VLSSAHSVLSPSPVTTTSYARLLLDGKGPSVLHEQTVAAATASHAHLIL
jgi:hypothetical protein